MQTAVNSIDNNGPTLAADISIEPSSVKNDLFTMELPKITTSTTTINAESTTCHGGGGDNDDHDDDEEGEVNMVVGSSKSPAKKLRRHHRRCSPQYALARQECVTICDNNTSSSSSTSSIATSTSAAIATADITVINNVANTNSHKAPTNTNTTSTTSLNSNGKLPQIPPQTLAIKAYGDSPDSENSSPQAPSTTPSVGTWSLNSSNISTPQAGETTSQDAATIELLQWKDMPQYLQFNPYVLRGYRPLQTFRGCLLSLFYWHNETINILTHGEF